MAYDSAANRRLLYKRQGGRCAGCLAQFPYRNLTVDRIRPQSKGGGHGIGNLQLLCAMCNSTKGAGTHEDLIARLAADGVILAKRSWPLLRRRKYAPATGGGTTMGPVAAAALTMALPYAAIAAEKYGPRLVAASKPRAKRAGRAVADGAHKARERARLRRPPQAATPPDEAQATLAFTPQPVVPPDEAQVATPVLTSQATAPSDETQAAAPALTTRERAREQARRVGRAAAREARRIRLRSPFYLKEAR